MLPPKVSLSLISLSSVEALASVLAGRVINHLRIDLRKASEDTKSRTFWRTADLLADPLMLSLADIISARFANHVISPFLICFAFTFGTGLAFFEAQDFKVILDAFALVSIR